MRKKTWRLLGLPARHGAAYNMAVDFALLRLHGAGVSPPTLRFYEWDHPAVSLGYFQSPGCLDLAACRALGWSVVRRPTGGWAVPHGRDLTYSVVAGPHDGLSFSPRAAYGLLSGGVRRGLRLLGVEAEAAVWMPGRGPRKEICFLSAAGGDLLHGGRKFAGSALKIIRGVSLLQQGSVALEPPGEEDGEALAAIWNVPDDGSRREFTKDLEARTTALSRILGRSVEAPEAAAALSRGLAQELAVVFEPGELTGRELALAEEIAGKMAAGGVSLTVDAQGASFRAPSSGPPFPLPRRGFRR